MVSVQVIPRLLKIFDVEKEFLEDKSSEVQHVITGVSEGIITVLYEDHDIIILISCCIDHYTRSFN